MRVLILGGDGYLGWPTAMHLAARGDSVLVADNYLRRTLALQTQSQALIPTPDLEARADLYRRASGRTIAVRIGDCADLRFLEALFREHQPEAVIHYAEQPSAPYSMRGFPEAKLTLHNNLGTTFALIWAVMTLAPQCHVVKLGTMGEYGTPNIDIEEGWLEVAHNGRHEKFLYPRQAGSLYHTTKVMDTDLLWFYVRTHDLCVTDLMQGPVYGLETPETGDTDNLLPNFHYDDVFGTVINRFLVQAVAGVPLTVYGKGGQIRGYLNLRDTLQCVRLALDTPPARGQMRILNQFTEQFTVNELAERVRRAAAGLGMEVRIESIPNPRKEKEEHYYNAAHSGLVELGLRPHLMSDAVLAAMIEKVAHYRDRIDRARIFPRVAWNQAAAASR